MFESVRVVGRGRVGTAVKEMHSYTTPAFLVIPIETVDPAYHAWIIEETSGAAGR